MPSRQSPLLRWCLFEGKGGQCRHEKIWLVAWHSGKTSVFGRWAFPVLPSTCSWWVTTYVGKPSATFKPIRPAQLFILSEVDKWVVSSNRLSSTSLGVCRLVNAYCLRGEGLVWLMERWCACWLQPWVQCPLPPAMDRPHSATAPLALANQLPLPRLYSTLFWFAIVVLYKNPTFTFTFTFTNPKSADGRFRHWYILVAYCHSTGYNTAPALMK